MISIRDLNKRYVTPHSTVTAVDSVSLEVARGDIYGIIGFSGAGKSTLIRCLNRLEEPDSGSVVIGGRDITAMDKNQLRLARQKIGMIFQQFNLLDAKTVFDNVAFPLEAAGYPREKIRRRVEEFLNLVGLEDKHRAYPLQLSGGQKQRVGIARALANEPEVILSDEATSALDPQTTYSILELLKDINKKFGVTIVLITHELDVLHHICNQMAVMEKGRIVEQGPVDQFFLNPESDTAKRFVGILQSFQSQRLYREGAGI
ncbi:MAG TPA: ATP-binding cassette domain-containing protein [Patescibacteria group bacterium]|nr:ATP-binding cassette domain-containing protein [Patescibacteria group bacterium]